MEAAQFSGGLYCTAGDMARFLSLQFQEKTPGGDQIVSPDGLRMMHLDSLGWGYGWAPKHKSIHHSGGQLYVKLRQDSSFNRPIIPLGNDKFSVEGDSDPWFFFLRDDKRKISKLKFTGYTFKRNTGK